MPADLAERSVTIAGRQCIVAGDPADSYFAWAEQHARNADQLHAVARSLLPPDGVALDVGASIGLTVLALAALLPAGRVIAVEPSPATLAALRRTVTANDLDARVTVAGVALGATEGEARFHAAAHSAGSHLLGGETLGGESLPALTVPLTTLDRLVASEGLARLDLIKIDVEGFETEVLDGATATLARFRPAVLVEFNAWTLLCNRNANPRAVLEDWLARFPVVHALRGTAPPERITAATAPGFLHDHLVERGCADDLLLGFDDAWVARWQPPEAA